MGFTVTTLDPSTWDVFAEHRRVYLAEPPPLPDCRITCFFAIPNIAGAGSPLLRYDILRALDYFRRAGVTPDSRMRDAVDVVRAKRPTADGCSTESIPAASTSTSNPTSAPRADGTPPRALRVLAWWNTAQ